MKEKTLVTFLKFVQSEFWIIQLFLKDIWGTSLKANVRIKMDMPKDNVKIKMTVVIICLATEKTRFLAMSFSFKPLKSK